MDKHSLLTVESIEAWIAKNEPWGKDKLAARMAAGELAGERAKAVLAYFARDAGFPLPEAVAQTNLEREALTSEARPVRNTWATRWVSWVAIVALALGVWRLVGA